MKKLLSLILALTFIVALAACTQPEATDSFKDITFTDATTHYNGEVHTLNISGELPAGATVTYENNTATEEGTYAAKATLRLGDEVKILNATLTVEAHRAGSHQGKGWEVFTDAVVHALAARREHLVFILWGSYAQKKCAFIDEARHGVIKSAHPSPLSAYRGFFGSQPFAKANAYLAAHGLGPIAW